MQARDVTTRLLSQDERRFHRGTRLITRNHHQAIANCHIKPSRAIHCPDAFRVRPNQTSRSAIRQTDRLGKSSKPRVSQSRVQNQKAPSRRQGLYQKGYIDCPIKHRSNSWDFRMSGSLVRWRHFSSPQSTCRRLRSLHPIFRNERLKLQVKWQNTFADLDNFDERRCAGQTLVFSSKNARASRAHS